MFGLDANIPEQKSLPPPQPDAKPAVVREEQDAAAAMKRRAGRASFRFFNQSASPTSGSGVNIQ